MSLLYRFGIFLYGVLLQIFQYFNPKARLFVQGRKNIFEKLAQINPQKESHIWFHFASLGEFEQGRPVIEAIRKQESNCKIAISFFSPSGYEIRKNTPLANIVCYLPLDSKGHAKQFLDYINPSKVYFTKYEFWHFYINEIYRRKIPLYLISGIFRADQIFFKSYGVFFRDMLQKFSHLFVQNEQSLRLLHSIGIENCSVCGDTRFDTVYQNALSAKRIPLIEEFKDRKICFVAGSTWEEDEKIIIKFLRQNTHIKCILAPHQIDSNHLNSLNQALSNLKFCFFSGANAENIKQSQVLVIDNIGMLASLYQYADITYVGGGFGNGIHNTLEAIAFGAPVIFGPKYHKFDEAKKLIEEKIGISIKNLEEFNRSFEFFKNNTWEYAQLSRLFIGKNTGATEKIIKKTS